MTNEFHELASALKRILSKSKFNDYILGLKYNTEKFTVDIEFKLPHPVQVDGMIMNEMTMQLNIPAAQNIVQDPDKRIAFVRDFETLIENQPENQLKDETNDNL